MTGRVHGERRKRECISSKGGREKEEEKKAEKGKEITEGFPSLLW